MNSAHEHFQWTCSNSSFPHGITAFADNPDMGLGSLASTAQAKDHYGNALLPWLCHCYFVCADSGLRNRLLLRDRRFPILRSTSHENHGSWRFTVAWQLDIGPRRLMASEFVALACSCFSNRDTCILARSRRRRVT